jgi:formate hydrogenlyase transcriptional activator
MGTLPEKRSLSQESRYRAFLQATDPIFSHPHVQCALQGLVGFLAAVIDFDFLAITLLDPTHGMARTHVIESTQPRSTSEIGTEAPITESLAGAVLEARRPLGFEDIDKHERWREASGRLRSHGLQSVCILPLATAHRQIGALTFGTIEARKYLEKEIETMSHAAEQVAVVLDNTLNRAAAESFRQQSLQQNGPKTLWELLWDYDPNGLIAIDREMNVLVVNPAFCRMFKVKAEEVIGKPAATVLPDATELMRLCTPEQYETAREREYPELGLFVRQVVFLIEPEDILGCIMVDLTREWRQKNEIARVTESRNRLAQVKQYLESEIKTAYNLADLIGTSAAWNRALQQVETVAPTDSTVLILGETGTGKELIARAIHDRSRRRERTLVKVGCAAIPATLLESELFGFEKGAFTGANSRKIGRIELADKGSLFLDEVGDVPLEIQGKLLRVIQEHEFERLGSVRTTRVDVRLIAATNRDLKLMVAEREFRSDLFYRLNVFPIQLPPLRERREDIPELVRHFVQKYSRRMNRQIEEIRPEDMDALLRHRWPGNVRELENIIEHAVILTEGRVLRVPVNELGISEARDEDTAGALTLEAAEREHIVRVLRQTNGAIAGTDGAAARLGLKRTTLYSKLRKLGISRDHI